MLATLFEEGIILLSQCHVTHLCPLIQHPCKYQSLRNPHSFWIYRAEGNLRVKGHWAKVKGHIAMIPPRDTPLSPNTSSLQIPIQNLHSFRRYRAGREFQGQRSLGQGQRSQCNHTTHHDFNQP
jgi:hypothetical protein